MGNWLKPAWIGVWFAAAYLAGNALVFYFGGSGLAAPISYVTAWPFSLAASELSEHYGGFLLLNGAFWYTAGHVLYHCCRILGYGVPSTAVLFMCVYAVLLGVAFAV